MSDDETFVARWSRLKRTSAEKAEKKVPAAARATAGTEDRPRGDARDTQPPERLPSEPPFDPATLPSIESIVADSDIRAFLQKGVPAELTKAALRRAWTTDPAIRDFIGIAENQWDFTDPTAIPGFGPLETSGNLEQLVAQAMGGLSEAPDAGDAQNGERDQRDDMGRDKYHDEGREEPIRHEAADASVAPAPHVCADVASEAASAPQHPEAASEATAVPARRGNGGALPR